MILVIGGGGQGKLSWTLAHSGYTPGEVSRDPGDGAPILCRLEELVRDTLRDGGDPQSLLPVLLTKEYVLCREVGCGVVPVDAADRRWREEVGRLCCALAGEARGVARLCCGIPLWLKGPEGES